MHPVRRNIMHELSDDMGPGVLTEKMAEKSTEQKGQKTFEQLEKAAQERGTNVVLGAKPDAPVIDNQEESGATGTGRKFWKFCVSTLTHNLPLYN